MPRVDWRRTVERLNLEIGRLEAVLQAHGIRKCHVCKGWEKPRSPLDGVGGIQHNDMGTDSSGLPTHVQCAKRDPA